jgi:hypothetical protein
MRGNRETEACPTGFWIQQILEYKKSWNIEGKRGKPESVKCGIP